MSRNARKLKGGLTSTRIKTLRILQSLENDKKNEFPNDPAQRLNPLYKNKDRLQSLKVGVVKEYLKDDLQESIELLQFKQNNLSNIDENMSWEDYVKAEIRALTYMTNGKSMKGLTGAIASYNMFKKRADNFTRGLDREQTGFTCGTVTCKERGQKIKEALTILATFSPDALGSYGVLDSIASAGNWFGKAIGVTSKPGYIDPDYATFLGLPPELVTDINKNDDGVNNGQDTPNGSSQSPPPTPKFAPATTQSIGKTQLAAVTPQKKGWFWGGKRTRRR